MPQEYQHHKPSTSSYHGLMLYILPSPLVFKLFISLIWFNLTKVLFTASALFFFYCAAHLTKKTLTLIAITPQHRLHRIPDNRLWGAIYVTVGVFILMLLIRRPMQVSTLMSLCAFIGYWFCYGLPQLRKKIEVDYENFPKATRKTIKQAYADLDSITLLGQQLKSKTDAQLIDALDKVIEQSYVIMNLLVETPEDATKARRFLNVYINRIKEVLQQYIKLAKHGKAEHLRQRLTETLNEVEKAFREKKSQLLNDDLFTLDIQLEVLDEQIKHEE